MWAEPTVVNFSTAETLPTDDSQTGQTFTVDGINFTADNTKKGTYSGASYLQISGKNYTGANLAFSLTTTCENIVFHTGANASTNVTVQLSANGENIGEAVKLDTKDADFTFTIPAANQAAGTVYKFTVTNKYNAQVTKLTFNAEGGDEPVDPDPVDPVDISNTAETAYTTSKAIELITAGQGLDTEVYVKGSIKEVTEVSTSYGNATYIITDGTSDLKVFRGYYLNGEKFTAEDQIAVGQEVVVLGQLTSYNGEPQVNKGSKIISINGQGPAEPDPATTVDNVAAAVALCSAEGAEVIINAPVTVIYKNGRYMWVCDATGNILVYNNADVTLPAYTAGDVIPAGIHGSAINYSQGQFQLKDLVAESFQAATAGEAVAPIELAIEELSADLVNQYVVIKGATIAAAEKDNTFTVTDETGSCTLFNQFWNEAYYDVVDVPEGTDITVYAMVNVYKGAAQLYPVKFEGGVEKVAAPEFSIEGGQVLNGTAVALTSATEGATIHYTIDGTEPTSTSTIYSEPIILVFDVTIKAIAVKEGLADSDVNEATFTVVEPVEGNEAYFPFATVDPSNYGFDMTDHTDYTKSQSISVVDQPISVAPVTITIAKGASQQGGAFYRPQNSDDRESFWTLRFYKKAIMTISAMSGYEIKSVSFEFENAAKHGGYLAKCDFNSGEFNAETGVWTGNAESLEIDGLNNDGGTISFKSITVTFDKPDSALDIEDNQDAPVEFYNLQGVRINGELTPGLYIRRQGTATSKVIIR